MAKKIRAINLLGGKCSNCGDIDIFHLVFHHVDEKQKKNNISAILEKRWGDIEGEVKKCKLLCYNCHQETHFPNDSGIKDRLLGIKGSKKCCQCGYIGKSNSSLSFHHIKEDKSNMWLSEKCNYTRGEMGLSIEEVMLEMDKCIVLCENCHQKEHTDIQRFNSLKEQIYKKIIIYKEKRHQLSVIEKEKIKQMAKKGLTYLKISKIIHCGVDTVRESIRRGNNYVNGYLNRINEKQILKLRKSGKSIREIADIMEITDRTIKKYLKKNNFNGKITLDYDRVVFLKKQGKRNGDIAKEMGCHLTTVSRILSRSPEIQLMREKNKIKEMDVVDMYRNKKSVCDIMRQVGYSDVGVYRILKRNGVIIPSRRVDIQKILNLKKEGKNLKNISKEAGCSRDSVYRILKKNAVS